MRTRRAFGVNTRIAAASTVIGQRQLRGDLRPVHLVDQRLDRRSERTGPISETCIAARTGAFVGIGATVAATAEMNRSVTRSQERLRSSGAQVADVRSVGAERTTWITRA